MYFILLDWTDGGTPISVKREGFVLPRDAPQSFSFTADPSTRGVPTLCRMKFKYVGRRGNRNLRAGDIVVMGSVVDFMCDTRYAAVVLDDDAGPEFLRSFTVEEMDMIREIVGAKVDMTL